MNENEGTFIPPAGFTSRPVTLDDLPIVVELMNAVSRADAGRDDTAPFAVRRYWESGDLDLAADTLLVFAPDGRAAGFGQFVEETPPEPYDVDSWVHPDFIDSGTGEALLEWIDRRAKRALPKAPEGVQVSIAHIPVYSRNIAAVKRLESDGYRQERVFHRMAIEFDGPPPEPVLPPGIAIRTFRRNAEERALYEAFIEAQTDEWGQENPLPFGKWVHYFIESEENFDPEAWFLAVEGDTIVGYALCRWDRAGEPGRSTVRYLAVRRAWRKRGIALALLHTAFGAMYRRGRLGAGLGVDATSRTGADRLYVHAGMHRAAELLHYRKVLRDQR